MDTTRKFVIANLSIHTFGTSLIMFSQNQTGVVLKLKAVECMRVEERMKRER